MRQLDPEAQRKARLEKVLRLAKLGLEMEDPYRVDVRGELTFGSNVRVEVNVIFKGRVSLGNDVTIGANCIIEDSVIEDGVAIRDFTTVSSSRVGSGSRVGPYARMRPGSEIGPSCQIGNFVETKEVTMGAGCKINHHSFVGNATLGEGVVIGAGSITCNHDGKGINQTVIEGHAYVGSGVMLIAPVRIGQSAVIAAGSNITKDVPANTLAICRTKEVVLKPLRR
jgi:bifunctional UDP-N-acetylglucosamine pyrophosphorylase / glucosamine-1-phosphate N-acetyltransferase